MFEHNFLYSVYSGNTIFSLRKKRSIKELINLFATFSIYSGLKPNHEKCKTSTIRMLKSVKVAVVAWSVMICVMIP